VDDAGNVADLAQAARRPCVNLDVLVEVNVGANRCGVEPGEPAVTLARAIAESPNLRFAGVQAYQGAAQHLRTPEQRQRAIRAAVSKIQATVELLDRNDLHAGIVTGAGTGTYLLEAASGVVQRDPARVLRVHGRGLRPQPGRRCTPVHEFQQSLLSSPRS
jgi:3-hydroxy-D-aspartate aldolase